MPLNSPVNNAPMITTHDGGLAAELEPAIRSEIARLEKSHPSLIGIQVLISEPPPRRRKRFRFTVRINMIFEGGEVVTTRDNSEDVYQLLREAFDAAQIDSEKVMRNPLSVLVDPGLRLKRRATETILQ